MCKLLRFSGLQTKAINIHLLMQYIMPHQKVSGVCKEEHLNNCLKWDGSLTVDRAREKDMYLFEIISSKF